MLHTEKLAFQCATLLSWEEGLQGGKAMNPAVLCGSVSVLIEYRKVIITTVVG